ncbi:MAG: transporter [Gemmatimonadales bacterium]
MLTVAMVTVGARAVRAQQVDSLSTIEADRPDFTDGVATLARHHLQFEGGYSYTSAGRGSGSQHSFPELLIRIGLSREVELRLGENFLVDCGGGSAATAVKRRSGLDDVDLGTKIRLLPQRGVIPALSAEASVTAPTGNRDVTGNKDRFLPGAALLLGWEIDRAWSAGVETFGTAMPDNGGSAIASFSVQYQAGGRWQLYEEGYVVLPLGGTEASQRYSDSGIHFFVSQDIQVDARIGWGFGPGSDRFFAGTGLAVRR